MPRLVTRVSAPILIGSLIMLCVISTAQAADRYYVEFRAAQVGLYGHSYIAYGHLSENGSVATVRYTDFHPEAGILRKFAGFLVPVDGNLTPEQDTLSLPILARYRHNLNAAEYRKLLMEIHRARTDTHLWNALANNCNYYSARMARSVGLQAPNPLLFAGQFVRALHDLNDPSAKIVGAGVGLMTQVHGHAL